MAIKQRILEKLDNIYKNLDAESGEILQRFHLIVDNLGEAQQLCEKGLPEKSYVKYDEYYSSLVMAFEQMLSGLDSGEVKEIIGLSREILQHIMAAMTNEENFKKEVVFLPYKYSMWDSLESVWQAANEDKDHTLAYVMPIPYADRNPDGSAAQWHCERNEFPSSVPTIDWREVDLKEWHPDVIIFHNPYDEYNKVTSVDPTYYSSKLKQYTDKLVYIPYYVLHEPSLPFDDPTKKDEVIEEEEKIAHYITVPGVLNADITVVQSEDMRRVYLDVLERHTNAGRDYWETRILGLGSPKFDKVANSRREDYELPKKWRKLINGRKTILYNTGLSAMLEHTDKYLIKLCSVLETFKAQKDVVLWWRPHPLLRATFQSMHPELLKEYDKIVKKYKQEGWGIYDDTAELERAIAWTDGYYGDWSSVVQLYEKTGKPIMVEKFKSTSEEELEDI